MNIKFNRLSKVNRNDIIALNTHPLVLRQMPLAKDKFDEQQCRMWVKEKEKHWEIYGYGLWALFFQMRLESVTILLPPSRNRTKGIFRLGMAILVAFNVPMHC
ncbi:hypothetical protein AB204_05330 [Xenorhabdus khoisanae]|uniref:Uncharacterized protein n=1 Tax=Xenorhabdus khoisanae TaxID=880157 RepID=A0A0J5ISE6_9GAMM|nr:hypothetical protein [Xenorhabdus khoisanae]KMJ46115.1 hypothetical protein AB204_05330 [Xenorhabdus khoisanae]